MSSKTSLSPILLFGPSTLSSPTTSGVQESTKMIDGLYGLGSREPPHLRAAGAAHSCPFGQCKQLLIALLLDKSLSVPHPHHADPGHPSPRPHRDFRWDRPASCTQNVACCQGGEEQCAELVYTTCIAGKVHHACWVVALRPKPWQQTWVAPLQSDGFHSEPRPLTTNEPNDARKY